MSYSDLTMKKASNIAYSEELNKAFERYKDGGNTPPFAIKDLLKDEKIDLGKFKKNFPDLDIQSIGDWKIVDVYDCNLGAADGSGCYGCVIDVGDGEAIVAFRGSEDPMEMDNLVQDWLKSDLGLLNNTLTPQQDDVYAFLKQIAESDYIDNYDSIGLAGHSLGGNLAMHGAVVSGMPEIGLDDKLARCVSFDGPGFSDEYTKENRELIEKVNEKITHYQWSVVGGLLLELPGVKRTTLKVKDSDDFLYHLGGKHAMESVIFDGENAVRGEQTLWDKLTSKFSQGLEHMPKFAGDVFVFTVSALAYSAVWMYGEMFDGDKLTPFGMTVILSAGAFAIGAISVFGWATVTFIGSAVLYLAAAFCAVVLYEIVYEFLETVVNVIADAVKEICDWVAEKYQEFKDFIAKGLAAAKEWLNKTFNAGYKYAEANPYIRLDTYNLSRYADRLRSVNNRINKLDRRLDSLYWKVGLLDIWNLMQADLLTGYSYRVRRCASYLEDTASDFNSLESKLANSL